MTVTRYALVETPIGALVVSGEPDAISGVAFGGPCLDPGWIRDDRAFSAAAAQISAYFAGELRAFALRLAPRGTPFQQRVWRALQRIPYGTTTTYAQVAASLDHARAVRAVGHANGRNPIAIIIPCHRLVGSDGSLTGYGGGLDRKQWLLEHERACAEP